MKPDADLPRVSVIIPVYNNIEGLRACLSCLEQQTYPRTLLDVIVVDNGSKPKVDTFREGFEDVRLVRWPIPGPYSARNHGIGVAKGEVIAFTDSDCMPAPDWVELGVRRLLSTDNCGWVAGKTEMFSPNANPSAAELWDVYCDDRERIKSQHEAQTSNLFTTLRVLMDAGRFDEDLLSSGDVDWTKRVHDLGYATVYDPAILVRHPARGSWLSLMRRRRRLIGGTYQLRQKHGMRRRTTGGSRGRRESIFRVRPSRGMRTLLRSSDLTLKKKALVAFVGLTLVLAQTAESFRLRLGGKPLR